jgi:hypothetical protein
MVNYRGPPKKWTSEESEELRTKPHGYSIDSKTGDHIVEELPGIGVNYQDKNIDINELMKTTTYTIKEHDTGQKYTITEHKQEEPKPKPKAKVMDTDQLIAEAKRLLQKQEPTKQEIQKEKQQKEFERTVAEWKKYYSENQGKIPNKFPKTFLDHEE